MMNHMIVRQFVKSPLRYLRTALLLVMVFHAVHAAAEVAVLPYRVNNPSAGFPESNGQEYAKLMGVAVSLRKGMEIYSPRDLEGDLRGFTLSPGEIITRENLSALGKARYLDLIVAGTLSRSGENFIAESRLYSVREDRVVSKSRVKAGNMFDCVSRDIEELFFGFPDAARGITGSPAVEAALVVDLSYNISREWNGVKKGIHNLADALSDSWENPLTLYLVPFSTTITQVKKTVITNPVGLKEGLNSLTPKGGNDGKGLDRAMDYAVRNMAWREGSARLMVVMVNSPVTDSRAAERLALTAGKRGIRLYTVSMGRQGPDDRAVMRQIAVIGKGAYRESAYRQKMYDINGQGIDFFMEGGRIFYSRDPGERWKEGLYRPMERADSRMQAPREYLSEIVYNPRKHNVTPYTLAKTCPDLADIRIINTGSLENNMDAVMTNIAERYFRNTGPRTAGRPAAKVLLSNEGISLWVRVNSEKDLDFFSKQKSMGRIFPLGVTIVQKHSEPYGVTFNPSRYITHLNPEYIPESMSVGLKSLLQKPARYITTGLFRPPVWFVSVKVEEIEPYRARKDIREEP